MSSEKKHSSSLDLVWGAHAIGREIDRSPRQAFYLLETRQIPAKKVGGRWVAVRRKLRNLFLVDASMDSGECPAEPIRRFYRFRWTRSYW